MHYVRRKKATVMTEKYLSASEAIEALEISAPTFYRFVKNGKIKKYYPTTMSKHGMYDPKEIARLGSKIRSEQETQEVGETDWIHSADIGHMYNLEYAAYGDQTGSPLVVRKWYERNPYICRILYNKADRRDFWGAINMLPLAEETIIKLLRKEVRDVDLNPQQDILTFENEGMYNFYIASVLIHPEKRQHFPLLLNTLFDFWCEQAPERTIGKIYGRVLSEQGELMAKKLFFSPLWHVADDVYMLDVSRPNPSRIIQSLQYCVKLKREEV